MWIPATYKSDRYAQWKQRTKAEENEDNDEDNMDDGPALKNGKILLNSMNLC